MNKWCIIVASWLLCPPFFRLSSADVLLVYKKKENDVVSEQNMLYCHCKGEVQIWADRKMSRTGIHDVKFTNKKEVMLVFFSEKKKRRPFCKGSTPKYAEDKQDES